MLSYGHRPKNLTSLVCKKIWRVSNSFMSNRAALESVLNNINIHFVRNGKEIEYKQAY